jgi:hypothetical protein
VDKIATKATLEWLKNARNAIRVARAAVRGGNRWVGSSATREIDAAIEALAAARSNVDGMTSARRAVFKRQIRKVLGYTYP